MERIAPMLILTRLQAENRTSPFSVLLIISLPRRTAFLLLWILSNTIAVRSFFPRLRKTETCVYLYITTCTSSKRYGKRYERQDFTHIWKLIFLTSAVRSFSTV